MEDIMSQVDRVLSDPEAMRQIGSIVSGLSQPQQTAPQHTGQTALPGAGELSAGDMAKMMSVARALSENSSDSSTALITALRPLLKPETQVKADRVIKLLRLMSALPALRESGLLSELL